MNTSLNYNICFDNDLSQLISYCNEQSSEIIVGTDSNTYKYCYPKLNPSFQAQIKHIIEIPAGDQNKNVEQVYHVYSELSKVNSRRNTLLLILGGGMCGDLFGYAASTYKRGIPFVHVPTSLLAMVDSSVGSKNGVNFQSYKNLIGTFTDPKAVFIHSPFLQTLPLRETISAFAECYKHAILDSPQHLELIRLKTKNGYDRAIATIAMAMWSDIDTNLNAHNIICKCASRGSNFNYIKDEQTLRKYIGPLS